jgi:hypothetical protein
MLSTYARLLRPSVGSAIKRGIINLPPVTLKISRIIIPEKKAVSEFVLDGSVSDIKGHYLTRKSEVKIAFTGQKSEFGLGDGDAKDIPSDMRTQLSFK